MASDSAFRYFCLIDKASPPENFGNSNIVLCGTLSSKDIGTERTTILDAKISGHVCKLEILRRENVFYETGDIVVYSVFATIDPDYLTGESVLIKFCERLTFEIGPGKRNRSFNFSTNSKTTKLNYTFIWKIKQFFFVDKEPTRDSKRYKKALLLESSHYLSHFYHMQEICDVTLQVGEKQFSAHKTVLSAASPVFKEMFENNFSDIGSDVVEIEGLESEAVFQMLKFIYWHEATKFVFHSDNPQYASLYEVAHKYDIKHLVKLCKEELTSSFTIETALDRLVLGDKCEDEDLKHAALNFICKHPPTLSDVSKYQRIMQQRPQLVMDILACKLEPKSNVDEAAEGW